MKAPLVTSRDNPLLRRARAARDRKPPDEIFVEGTRLCEEAFRSPLAVSDVICTESFANTGRGADLLKLAERRGSRVVLVGEKAFDSLSDTKTPQGVALLAARPRTGPEVLAVGDDKIPLIVVMHRVGNPANAGAILRTAEAAGATGGITTRDSADLFAPKALRGAMGSSFRLPLWTGARWEEVSAWCARHAVRTVSTDAHGAAPSHTEIDWRRPRALVLGAEATGLGAGEMRATDEVVRIPMREPVESLNVAVAAAVLLYEAARQRAET